MSYLWVLDNFCVLKMYFACKGTIKWAKYQKKQEFFSGISECEYLLVVAVLCKSDQVEHDRRGIAYNHRLYLPLLQVCPFVVCPPFIAYPIFIHRLARSTPIRYPFNVLSTLFRGHKNVSSPIFSGTWVGDEWDMSGTHVGEMTSKFPWFSLEFPSKRRSIWGKNGRISPKTNKFAKKKKWIFRGYMLEYSAGIGFDKPP